MWDDLGFNAVTPIPLGQTPPKDHDEPPTIVTAIVVQASRGGGNEVLISLRDYQYRTHDQYATAVQLNDYADSVEAQAYA